MAAYYNELDPYAAQWLRNLIAKGHIAAGDVDERSIEDVRPDDLRGYTQCHFFAGLGAWSYALRLADWPDDRPVWTGSCPCQPFSAAGKGAGFADERHLWPAWHWLIQQRRPSDIYGEQVSGKDAEPWLDLVFTDLEADDYACTASYFPAAGIGAPHIRERTLWMANATRTRRRGRPALARWSGQELGGSSAYLRSPAWPDGFGSGSNERVTDVLSPSYGTPGRVGRMRAYGNSIVAQAAAEFIRAAREAIE